MLMFEQPKSRTVVGPWSEARTESKQRAQAQLLWRRMGATGNEGWALQVTKCVLLPRNVRCFPSSCLFVVRASSESHFSILLSFFSFCRPSAHKFRHELSIIFRLTSDVVSCCPLSPIFLSDLSSSCLAPSHCLLTTKFRSRSSFFDNLFDNRNHCAIATSQ